MQELYIELDNKKSFNLERDFTTAYLKKIRNKGYYAYKISDSGIGTKPFDTIIYTKEAYYCEVKIIEKDIFPINRLRDNQYTALKHINELGGNAIVIVYSKQENKYKIIPFNIIKGLDRNNSIKLIFNN